MAKRGKATHRKGRWWARLRILGNMLDVESDANLAWALGVGVKTLNSWRVGRTEPRGPALKLIEIHEHLLGDMEPDEMEGPPGVSGSADESEELDYWSYVQEWRRRLTCCGMRYHGRFAGHVKLGHAARGRAHGQRGTRPRLRDKEAGDRHPPFPPEHVAEREGLSEDERVILLRVLIEQVPGAEAQRPRGSFWRRDDRLTGRVLLDTVCTGADEYAKKVGLLGPAGKLRKAGLVDVVEAGASLLEAEFTLTPSARAELVEGLPEGLVGHGQTCDLCRVVSPAVGLDGVVVPKSVRDRLADALAFVRHRNTIFGKMGFARTLHYGRGAGLLFHGAPGTGKTLAAGALAHELGRELWTVDFSRVVSKWVGETEKHITRLFRDASRAGPVLLIDEADGLLATRDMAARSWEIRDVNVILQEIERYEGVVVLTTNNQPCLDRALERRLLAVVDFPRPGKMEREAIWRLHLPPEAVGDNAIDFTALAHHDLSGGQIKQAALSAATAAVRRDGDNAAVRQDDLEAAARSLVKEAPTAGFGKQASA